MTYFSEPHQFDAAEIDLSLTIARQLATASERQESADALRKSEERFRLLSETLEAEVRSRTRELQERSEEVLRESERVRELSGRLLQSQDEERRRVARELHDSAGQTLTILGMSLAQVAHKIERFAPHASKDIESTQQLVRQLHNEIRTTSYLLHPPLLDETGLASALAWYTEGLSERSDLKINLSIPNDFGRIPRELELVVFRVTQECLTNIHRHASAANAWIRVARTSGSVSLEIADDGKGMSAEKFAEVQSGRFGFGIRGLQERVRQFQGKVNIESTGAGTRVVVAIPLPTEPVSEDSKDPRPLQAAI